jgi:ribosome-binding ATPase YchF (GTP1/OBG family)
MNIKECAGIIHSDFQNKFIVGEVININALNSFSPGLQ